MTRRIAAALIALSLALPAGASTHDYADGEVRKVDKEAAKVTLRHGPIENLEMPAMTMVFRVKDPAMLEKMRPGKKIRFRAEKIGGQYTVTALEEKKQ